GAPRRSTACHICGTEWRMGRLSAICCTRWCRGSLARVNQHLPVARPYDIVKDSTGQPDERSRENVQEIKNLIRLSLHEPERLIDAARTMAEANQRELDRIGKIIRGRELRRSLRGELGGQHDSAATLH